MPGGGGLKADHLLSTCKGAAPGRLLRASGLWKLPTVLGVELRGASRRPSRRPAETSRAAPSRGPGQMAADPSRTVRDRGIRDDYSRPCRRRPNITHIMAGAGHMTRADVLCGTGDTSW